MGTARGAAAGCACLLAGMRRSFLIPHIGTTSLLKQRGREKEDNVYDDRVQDSKLIFLPCSPFFEMFNHPRPQDNSTRSKSLQHDQCNSKQLRQKQRNTTINQNVVTGKTSQAITHFQFFAHFNCFAQLFCLIFTRINYKTT